MVKTRIFDDTAL